MKFRLPKNTKCVGYGLIQLSAFIFPHISFSDPLPLELCGIPAKQNKRATYDKFLNEDGGITPLPTACQMDLKLDHVPARCGFSQRQYQFSRKYIGSPGFTTPGEPPLRTATATQSRSQHSAKNQRCACDEIMRRLVHRW